MDDFQAFVHRQRTDLACIANMDETPMQFDIPSSRTIERKGAKTVQIRITGNEKNGFTLVLTCMADGTKLKPMLIFKRKTRPKGKFPNGVVIHVSMKGWMEKDAMYVWFKEVWATRPGTLLRKKALLRPCVGLIQGPPDRSCEKEAG